MSELYDTDFTRWAGQQAALLRRRAANEIDWDNIAEEIESLGKSDQRELGNRIVTILDHLMRLAASPAQDPRRGWRLTIAEQRRRLAQLLRDSPGLQSSIAPMIAAGLADARREATLALEAYGEQPSVPLDQLSYTETEVRDPDFWP